jgi:hypothetical protein
MKWKKLVDNCLITFESKKKGSQYDNSLRINESDGVFMSLLANQPAMTQEQIEKSFIPNIDTTDSHSTNLCC